MSFAIDGGQHFVTLFSSQFCQITQKKKIVCFYFFAKMFFCLHSISLTAKNQKTFFPLSLFLVRGGFCLLCSNQSAEKRCTEAKFGQKYSFLISPIRSSVCPSVHQYSLFLGKMLDLIVSLSLSFSKKFRCLLCCVSLFAVRPSHA